jgi:hypothetical protein
MIYIYIYSSFNFEILILAIYIASEKQGWAATNSSIDDGHSTLVHSGYLLCSLFKSAVMRVVEVDGQRVTTW